MNTRHLTSAHTEGPPKRIIIAWSPICSTTDPDPIICFAVRQPQASGVGSLTYPTVQITTWGDQASIQTEVILMASSSLASTDALTNLPTVFQLTAPGLIYSATGPSRWQDCHTFFLGIS